MDRIRAETGALGMTVGAIESIDHANTVVGAGRAGQRAIACRHSSDPYMTQRATVHHVSSHPWSNQRPSPCARV